MESITTWSTLLIEKRWKSAVRLCRTFQGADIASDHSLILCNLKLRLKHSPRRQYEKRRNMQALDNSEIRIKYQKWLKALHLKLR